MKRVSAVLALAIASAFSAQAAVTQTTRYVIISENNGKQMGEQVVENHDDGLTRVRYIYKDNGRGPELSEEFRQAIRPSAPWWMNPLSAPAPRPSGSRPPSKAANMSPARLFTCR
jgi:hypothetical protein